MNVVRLSGGLGNQMFQYAFGKALGNDTLFDNSWFELIEKDVTYRKYELCCFNCTIDILDGVKLHSHYVTYGKFPFKRFIRRRYESNETKYIPSYLNVRCTYMDGYFQNERYFLPIRQQLLNDFTPRYAAGDKFDDLLQRISERTAISIHVRRGDYIKYQHIFNLCPIEYYNRSIVYMLEHIKNPVFYIFSNDIPWCRENLSILSEHYFVDNDWNGNSICDMMLMKACKHNIIANSSYSWWGAWLNENPDKIVIAPKQWFADGRDADIVPADWIKM